MIIIEYEKGMKIHKKRDFSSFHSLSSLQKHDQYPFQS